MGNEGWSYAKRPIDWHREYSVLPSIFGEITVISIGHAAVYRQSPGIKCCNLRYKRLANAFLNSYIPYLHPITALGYSVYRISSHPGCKRDPSRGNLWCKECAMQRKRLSSVSSARTSVASTGSPQLGLGLLESPDSNTRKRPEQHSWVFLNIQTAGSVLYNWCSVWCAFFLIFSRIFAELVAKLPPYDFQIHKRCKLGNI